MVLAIAALSFITIFLVLYIFIISGVNRQRLDERFKTAGVFSSYTDFNEELSKPLYQRLLAVSFEKFGQFLTVLTPGEVQRLLADKLIEAGQDKVLSVRRFLLRWGLVGVALVLASLFVSLWPKPASLGDVFLNSFAALLLSMALPFLVLRRQISERKIRIQKHLPDVIDLLLVSIQAGTSFDGAIAKVTQQMQGPFIVELQTMLREIRLGMERQEALRGLARRCRVQDVSLFVSSLLQTDRLGVSTAQVLEVQAKMLRQKRVLKAREAAMKAPIKLMFPLLFFFLPVVCLAILAPVAVRMLRWLG